MKKQYRKPQLDLILLSSDDIITLSSILEPDYEEENNENQG